MAGLVSIVIPGRRVSAGPGIQMQSLNVFSGFRARGLKPAPPNDSRAAFSLPLSHWNSDVPEFGTLMWETVAAGSLTLLIARRSPEHATHRWCRRTHLFRNPVRFDPSCW